MDFDFRASAIYAAQHLSAVQAACLHSGTSKSLLLALSKHALYIRLHIWLGFSISALFCTFFSYLLLWAFLIFDVSVRKKIDRYIWWNKNLISSKVVIVESRLTSKLLCLKHNHHQIISSMLHQQCLEFVFQGQILSWS